MSIWFQGNTPDVNVLNQIQQNTIATHLGIEFTEAGPDFIVATMPVDERTRQPYGRLHGGASVVLAETLGSVAAALTLEIGKANVVGLEINANHLRGVTEGVVSGTARPVHIGRTTQVWSIEISNEAGKLTCISRITMAVLQGA